MEITFIYIMYFGALLVPLGYFAIRGRSGQLSRRMLKGAVMQLIFSAGVFGFVWYCWKAGYSEYYWGNALYLPVNAFSLLYYCCAPLIALRREGQPNQSMQPDSTSPDH